MYCFNGTNVRLKTGWGAIAAAHKGQKWMGRGPRGRPVDKGHEGYATRQVRMPRQLFLFEIIFQPSSVFFYLSNTVETGMVVANNRCMLEICNFLTP